MPGTAYVLFHHVMGESDGARGVWGYVRGGMGGLTQALAAAARDLGAEIRCDAEVARILVRDGKAVGVALADGDEFHAPVVASNADANVTFLRLLDRSALPEAFVADVERINYASASLKINVALAELPGLHGAARARSRARSIAARSTSVPTRTTSSAPSTTPSTAAPPQQPVLECTIPSVVDPTVAPPGSHLMSMFVQYAPYELRDGSWDDQRDAFADRCFDLLDEYAPNFKRSVLDRQVLAPLDLERDLRPHRRQHLPGRDDSRPALRVPSGARLRALPDAGRGPLPVRRRGPSRRRRDGHAGPQCRPGDPRQASPGRVGVNGPDAGRAAAPIVLGVVPQTQYAKKGDAHIAYQIVGEGNPQDIVLVSTWFSHVEARWDLPGYAHYLSRLASFSRLISFDKYGIGLSDPIPSRELPPLEDWMDDVSAVMDAVGLERAVIAGAGEASPMAELFAATYPERTSALVLMNATARISAAPGYEIGAPPEVQEGLLSMVEQTWGRGDIIAAINPSLAGDTAAIEAWGRFLRLSASPATAAAVMRMLFELDVRDVLPSIRVPTLVVHRRDNPIVTVDQGRYVAEHIEGAKFVAVPGADFGLGVGDIDVLIDEVEEFLTGSRPAHATDRVLATVLFTDIVDSTPRAVELGDARWRELLERHDELAATEVARFGGTISDFAGDGLLATFDGPARAVRCAFALRDRLRALGLDMRAGLHTGEVERRRGGIAGIGVHIAARVSGLAGAGEVLVSRTVRDLVTGSGLSFVDRGAHSLKGVPDEWEILEAVE